MIVVSHSFFCLSLFDPTRRSLRCASFDSELLMMNSMRLPKRLTIHGDDEKDHMFLVSDLIQFLVNIRECGKTNGCVHAAKFVV